MTVADGPVQVIEVSQSRPMGQLREDLAQALLKAMAVAAERISGPSSCAPT